MTCSPSLALSSKYSGSVYSGHNRDKRIEKRTGWISVVFPPRVPALAAPEEPDLALVGSPELAEPPEGKVMLALGAFYCDCGQSADRSFLLDDHDLLLAACPRDLHLVILVNFPVVTAFPALQLACRRDHQASAFRAEHQPLMRLHARLRLV